MEKGSIQADAFPTSESINFEKEVDFKSKYIITLSKDDLTQVHGKLTKFDKEDLKFLCKCYIQPNHWRKADSSFELFRMLESRTGKEKFPRLIAELLFTIQRFDLLKLTGICKHRAEELFAKESTLDPLKKLLYQISDSLDTEEANEVASALYHLVSPDKQSKDLNSLFLELCDDDNLHTSFLQTLQTKLRNEDSDYADKLQPFLSELKREKQVIASGALQPVEQSWPPSPLSSSDSSLQGSARYQLQFSEDYYDMSRSPCGICAIINNRNFHVDNPGIEKLSDREGTDIDRDKLKKAFEDFDFRVISRDNLTHSDTKNFLNSCSKQNHSEYSCFICCVLSHGTKGTIATSDCKYLDIQTEIISLFSGSNCPSLLGKPKLFFIQACQGEDVMASAYVDIEEDGPSTCSLPSISRLPSISLPDLSDYLLACATVPGFKSVRSISKGSWFIGLLITQLDLSGDAEDILKVLTDVNKKLANRYCIKTLASLTSRMERNLIPDSHEGFQQINNNQCLNVIENQQKTNFLWTLSGFLFQSPITTQN